MILDLEKFLDCERPYWQELETMLTRLESGSWENRDIESLKRFHYLYQRASSDLSQLMTFSAKQEIRVYLEELVARAYSEIHEVRGSAHRFSPFLWFFGIFPETVRRHRGCLLTVIAVTCIGIGFGGAALLFDPDSKAVMMPFAHLQGSPSERVAEEMEDGGRNLEGQKTVFSTELMTHNIRVSIMALALGLTFGAGTVVVLFYNGVILGAVCTDYIVDGQLVFLLGWLLPHGAVEIPAFLIAGQAGLVLAQALIGKSDRVSRQQRLRSIVPDLTTLIGGVAVFLIWAGIVEAFFSQYHEPVLPYSVKIAFGSVELVLLGFLLAGKIKLGRQVNGTR